VNKPFHPSTNPEILKIGPLPSEKSRPLKYILKNKKKTSAKYISLLAGLPSGLNKFPQSMQWYATLQTDNFTHFLNILPKRGIPCAIVSIIPFMGSYMYS